MCVSQLVVGEEVFNKVDMTESEATEWLEVLTQSQYQKIIELFKSMPKLSNTITLKNKNTDKEFTVKLEWLQDFF